jgi:hypothetical protein
MHEAGALTWRDVVERHHSTLVYELSERLDSDLREAVSLAIAAERSLASDQLVRTREEVSRAQAELLNQALRRMRHANGDQQILQALVENIAPYAFFAVVLVFENNQARVAASGGFERGQSTSAEFGFDFAFAISDAPALVTAIESGDPVVALATPGEISSALADKLNSGARGEGEPEDESKAYLFPIRARQSVVALLLASRLVASGSTAVNTAPIELLCEAAGMRLESVEGITQPKTLAVADSGQDRIEKRLSWDTLSPEDQRLHLQAQRTARLRVAEMRLYNEADLRRGVAGGNIYEALQPAIDSARGQFLQDFLAKSATMVDYLHLEILQSLAHDKDALLGPGYPGPMV